MADTSVVVETAQVHTHDEAVRVARAVLDVAATRRPSAVFCVTDVLALGVLDAARQLGLSVPADVSVVGFDDIEEASRAVPPLTTVKQDLEGKGRVAARAVLDRIAGQKPRVPRLSAHLVVRESTAEVPGRRGRRSHAP